MIRNRLLPHIIGAMITFLFGCEGTLYSFSFKSLSPYALTERMHIQSFGSNDASCYYQDKVHKFLSYLDVKDQDQVNIRRLEVSIDTLQSNLAFSSFVGLALWTGIWVDEVKLEKVSEAERLWTLALLTAQYKLNISLKNVVLTQILPWGAGLVNVAGIMLGLPLIKLCGNKFSKTLMIAMIGLVGARISLMIYSSFIQKWYSYYKHCERESTIIAAKLLCENGYADAFEKHLQLFNGSRDELTLFWNEWREQHSTGDKTAEPVLDNETATAFGESNLQTESR